MSNENSTNNKPRRRIVSTSVASGRSRRFSCITYLNETQLKVRLMQHINQIRCYEYAFHDKDVKKDGTLKEPHFHVIIITHCTLTVSAIRRWFSGYVDENGEITTTAQICSDVYTMHDYLTHSTKEAIAEGKYQYDKSIVVSSDKEGYFKASEESEYDTITLALESLLNGGDIHTLAKRYGRDFILHYNAIKQVVCDITRCEKHGMDIDSILEHEYQMELANLNEKRNS